MTMGWASIRALKLSGSSRSLTVAPRAGQLIGDPGQQRLGFRGGATPAGGAADADARGSAGSGVGITKVSAGHGAGEQGAVADSAGDHADRVEAVGHDLHADAADQAEVACSRPRRKNGGPDDTAGG